MLGVSLYFSYSQKKSISCNKAQPTVKMDLAWSVIVADNFGVTDNVHFWGAEGAPILFSEIGFCMASCSYIYIICMYVYIYLSRWRRRGVR